MIYSDDYKINCGSTCSANFNGGIIVNLNTTPDAGYIFSNWSNGCTGSGACSILMNSAKAVLATFNPAPTYAIGLIANPSAGGSVTCSVNPVIQGGSTNCTATPNTGYTFTGFGGDCYGTSCSLTNITVNKTVTANFTAITYPINATANPSLGGNVSCSVNPVTYGGSSNCTATPNSGYTFTGFSGDCNGTNCSLTNVTGNKTVTANFTAITYPINATANPSIGGNVSCSVNPVAYGGSSNCAATPNSGYTFTGFGGDCSGTSCSLTNVTATKTVTANFTAITYPINATANPSIGGSVSCSVNPVAYGGSSNCTATANAGYTFTGFAGDCYGTSCSLNNVTSNKTVTANFTAITYPINATANPSIGGSVNCSVNPVTYGGSSNCTATPNSGYTFTGFAGDCYGTSCSLTNVTATKTVTANFTAITYPINATANPSTGGNVSCSVNPVAYGGSSNCAATANAGYTFTGFGGDCYGTSCSLTNVTATKTVTANFTAITYPITATANPSIGGSVNCSVNPVSYGGSSNCSATPNAGYTFTGFGGDCYGTSCSLTNVTATKTVTANFTAITYPINATANPSIGGSVTCSVNPVIQGGSTNCTATPNNGYSFTGFSGDCSGTSCSLNNVTANKTVTANFTAITYPINATANPSIGGNVICSVNPVTYGGSSNCTATPKTGYNFTNFSGDCSGTSCSLTNVTSNKTVTANFTAITYPITATANPSIGGNVICSVNPVTYGGSSNCTATANAGYTFTGFGGDCSGTSCSLTNVTATKTVTANFTAITYPINATANPSLGGNVSCSVNPVTYGSSSNCAATANTGYTFTGFGGDCSGTSCSLTNVTATKTVTANFTAITYPINATANPSLGGNVSCSVNPVTYGSSSNCAATANTGYTFTGFGGDCYGTSCSLTNVTATKTVTANFTAITYPINATANPSIGGSVSCSVNPVAYGGSSNCAATANTGYTFTGFGGDCSGTSCSLTNVTATKTVTANFTAITYPINAAANPSIGGSVSCSVNPVVYGGSSNCAATANTGYTFTGFGGDCSGTSCSLTNVTANKTVTANFTAITYPINATANPSIGGNVSCSVNPVAYGSSSNCTATANAGYTFTGFAGDCSGTSCSLTNITATKTVTANFTAITYPINATANPSIGGNVSCSVNPVTYGGSSNCTATPKIGYNFTNFSGDCSGTSCSLTNVTSNKTVTANFTAITYPINATANPSIGGNVSCSVNPVSYGGSSNCTATPKTGYNFSGFSGDCGGTSCSLTNVTSNKTVTANFTAITYPITATANPSLGGNVSCSVNPVTYGGSSNCTATPKTGYNFSGFSGDCSGTSCSLTNVTVNKTVTANFTAITYPINATANPSLGGSVNCSVNPVAYGGSSNCVVTANAGYTFTGFGGDCSGTSCSLNNVTGNKTVTANFTAITYPINATANPSIGGNVSCSVNPVAYGGSSNCTATPKTGYNFSGFSGDCSGTSCSLTNVTANKTVTANFKLTAGYVLNVIKKGTGSGVVTTTDGKISCGMDCNESYMNGKSVTLKAISDVGSVFTGWSGDCSGTNTCTVSMNAVKNITATFTTTAVDLVITNMVITPASPSANDFFDISVTVKNFAKKALDAGDLTIWKSQTKLGTCGALGNARTRVGTLAVGASRTLTARLRAPNAGTYTARAFIDSRCVTTETSEKDNQLGKLYTVK
ncbi:beta strand repeat-containing protein [Chromatium okenii]|uniref:beta strand repeat-containing protein n=1 Tax=Chromatium okenii TaxID=61644 RepID=UPI001F5B9291